MINVCGEETYKKLLEKMQQVFNQKSKLSKITDVSGKIKKFYGSVLLQP